MNSQDTRLLATLVAATVLLGVSTASAEEWQPEQRTISLRGLDPATPAGAYKLHREIVTAANRVCGSTVGGRGIAARRQASEVARCRQQAITASLQAVDAAFGLDLEQLAGVTGSEAPAVAQTAER